MKLEYREKVKVNKECKHIDGFYIEDREELNKFENLVYDDGIEHEFSIKVKCNNMDCSHEKIIKIRIEQI